MEHKDNIQYRMGYVDGYLDGLRDAARNRKNKLNREEIESYPIEAMNLSTRAHGCLSNAGCVCVGDVLALSDKTIATMRNMGKKTAAEIACWLHAHGICSGAWWQFLQREALGISKNMKIQK